ncbi:hypothetical protein Vadar_001400 [Vaccinium darrowii]|uniref:Uncharacterized protein n=1 Tax=Vaccinium darrowii TaxID=229202 RepID=A0ACB7ZHS9_9ERIC|nr:hypothetical protein Vadar_001400 [Vaccinium darrowii]
MDKLSLPVMTSLPIRGEGPTPLRVALINATTKQVVTSGLEASAKIQILTVTIGHLKNLTIRLSEERKGKKTLLTGNVHLNLEEGVGLAHEISSTHYSHWMKVCKLRLGRKVVDNPNGIRVREAVTEPFVLRDFRNSCKFFWLVSIWLYVSEV